MCLAGEWLVKIPEVTLEQNLEGWGALKVKMVIGECPPGKGGGGGMREGGLAEGVP